MTGAQKRKSVIWIALTTAEALTHWSLPPEAELLSVDSQISYMCFYKMLSLMGSGMKLLLDVCGGDTAPFLITSTITSSVSHCQSDNVF